MLLALSLHLALAAASATDSRLRLARPPSTTNVSFGVIEEMTGVVTHEQTISIRNVTGSTQTFTLSADALPSGATSPSCATV